jgi:ribonucleotide reductase alpha subunit
MPVVPSRPSKFAVWCDSSHENIDDVKPEGPLFLNGSTPTYHVADSREGWVEALRLTMMSAYKGEDFIADVSGVRPRGRPIKTFGGIACGPGPLAKLLRSTSDIIRGAAGRRLNSVECLDITNHIGLCIKSGNVRRSALIVLGSASDQDFRDAKKDQGAVISHRHTSNNSIVFRTWEEIAGFDWHSLVEDNIDFGEPGILNMPLIWQTDPGARGVNPCFAGDTLIAVADGRNAVSIKQLADEGQDVPVYSMDKATGKVEIKTARNPRVTGYRKSLVRVWLDDGGYVDTTPDHKFLLRDGTPIEAAALKPGMSLPRFTKEHGDLDQAVDLNGRWSGFSNEDELGLEYIDEDPRVLATYQAMLRQGYSCSIAGGKVLVSRACEGCRSDFQVEHAYRECSFCSAACGNTHSNTNLAVKARRTAGMDATYSDKATVVKTEQARLYSDLKYNLGRGPNRREWSLFCKKEGVPSRIGPTLKHGFRSFQDVAVAGGSYNHKVVRVEQLEGEHTVYNLTVDDFHTVSVVTSSREKRGKVSYTGVYVMQCGEQALHDREACNLAEVFPAKFEAGLDPSVAFRLVTRYSLRQRLTPLMDPQSHAIGQENMRIGVGLGGFCDFNWTPTMLAGWFADCRKEADSYADELGVNRPLTVTTVKPSGCRPWCALTSTNKGLLTLEELFQEHPAGQEWAAMGEGYYALQGASQSRITKTYNNGLAPVYRIRLSCGLEVESTGNHQWFCQGHHDRTMTEDPRWVRADRLRLGDVLDVKLGVYTAERKASLQVVKGSYLRMRGESDNILQPKQMTPDLAWLVGYLWGTPVSSDLKLRFEGDSSRCRLDKLQRVSDTYFGVRPIPESGLGSALILRLDSSTILSWLTLNGLLKFCSDSPGLIPSVIRASGQEEIIAFISGMSDATSAAEGSYSDLTIHTDDSAFTRHLQSVCWAVGLGGALSTDGQSLTLKPDLVTNRASTFLKAHSTVVIDDDLRDIIVGPGGELEDGLGDDREACQTAGKVEGLELLGEMPTYDIEVEDTHWYYAGCVKSHNTISLLNGSSPGVHAPHAAYYIRRTRIAKNDPMAQAMVDAGVPHVDDVYDTTGRTWAFEFPMKSANATVTSKNESVRSQFERQATIQKWWADNAVSATLNFDKVTEREELAACLKEFVPQLKSTSCLPKAHGYAQAPYEEIDEETYRRLSSKIDNDHKLTNAGGMDTLQGLDECAGGVCPVR